MKNNDFVKGNENKNEKLPQEKPKLKRKMENYGSHVKLMEKHGFCSREPRSSSLLI